MPSKSTLAIIACLAYGSAVMALPMQDSFAEREVSTVATPLDATAQLNNGTQSGVAALNVNTTAAAPVATPLSAAATPSSPVALSRRAPRGGKGRRHRKHRKHHKSKAAADPAAAAPDASAAAPAAEDPSAASAAAPVAGRDFFEDTLSRRSPRGGKGRRHRKHRKHHKSKGAAADPSADAAAAPAAEDPSAASAAAPVAGRSFFEDSDDVELSRRAPRGGKGHRHRKHRKHHHHHKSKAAADPAAAAPDAAGAPAAGAAPDAAAAPADASAASAAPVSARDLFDSAEFELERRAPRGGRGGKGRRQRKHRMHRHKSQAAADPAAAAPDAAAGAAAPADASAASAAPVAAREWFMDADVFERDFEDMDFFFERELEGAAEPAPEHAKTEKTSLRKPTLNRQYAFKNHRMNMNKHREAKLEKKASARLN